MTREFLGLRVRDFQDVLYEQKHIGRFLNLY